MHLRVNTTRRGSKIYRYAQLVQSVRDENGNSTTRVIKHLGNLDEAVIDALRIALKAQRSGSRLFLSSELAKLLSVHSLASRRFLDIAVLVDCWRQWEMASIFEEILPSNTDAKSFDRAVQCLALQRCCEPGSKLGATRWLPKTAAPQILGFEPRWFNNSRIHRVLDLLHQATPALQDKLASKCQEHAEDPGVLFMDVTDTYFEGIGCPLAEQTRTKTEMPNKRCLAIVMLVNQQGYPLRWQLVGGKTKDWTAMQEVLEQIGNVPWISQKTIVFDRAMGNRSTVEQLHDAGLWFLTAAHRSAIESYTANIPAHAFHDVKIEGTDSSYKEDIERVARAARKAGFEEIDDRLFAFDLGVANIPPTDKKSKYTPRLKWRGRPSKLAENLQVAYETQQLKQDNPKLTQQEMSNILDVSISRIGKCKKLLKLCPEIHEQILEMKDDFPVPEKEILKLVDLKTEQQNQALAQLLTQYNAIKAALKEELKQRTDEKNSLNLRLVAYFNPQLFVDTRRRAQGHCELLQKHQTAFNEELASAKRSRDRDPTYRKFSRELERLSYMDTFDIELKPITSTKSDKIKSFMGTFVRNELRWQKRRKYDGFVLLLAHPDLPHSAKELVKFYRGKDVVEKGFQAIKSFVKLRPVYHYTDPKVDAHVTVCMLALMLMKTLRQRLHLAKQDITEQAALEILKDCRLEERNTNGTPIYYPTKLNPDQQMLLSALKLLHLAEPGIVGEQKGTPM